MISEFPASTSTDRLHKHQRLPFKRLKVFQQHSSQPVLLTDFLLLEFSSSSRYHNPLFPSSGGAVSPPQHEWDIVEKGNLLALAHLILPCQVLKLAGAIKARVEAV